MNYCVCWGVTAGPAHDPTVEKVSHLACEIRSAQSESSALTMHVHYSMALTGPAHNEHYTILFFYNQSLSTLSSRRTVNFTQPYQVSILAQVPAPL